MSSGFGAVFTDERPTFCEGSRCPHKASGRPVPPVDYMLSARPGMGARWLCADCLQYYRQKSAQNAPAWFTTPASAAPPPPPPPNDSGIRLGNAAGQRGERALPVVPVGHPGLPPPAGARGLMGPPPIPHVPNMIQAYPGYPPPLNIDPRHGLASSNSRAGPQVSHPPLIPHAAGSLGGGSSSSGAQGSSHQAVRGPGPTVFVAGSSNLQQMMACLQSPSTGQSGYNITHQLYSNIRDSLQRQAFHGIRGAEQVVVSAQMVVNEHGRKRPTPVAAVRESLAHIPARIGAHLLKVYVCATLFLLFSTWSRHAVPLTIDECKLRNSQGVELLPAAGVAPEDDHDAISDGLYVEKGKGSSLTWTFKLSKNRAPTVDVMLEIPLDVYHAGRRNAERDDDDETPLNVVHGGTEVQVGAAASADYAEWDNGGHHQALTDGDARGALGGGWSSEGPSARSSGAPSGVIDIDMAATNDATDDALDAHPAVAVGLRRRRATSSPPASKLQSLAHTQRFPPDATIALEISPGSEKPSAPKRARPLTSKGSPDLVVGAGSPSSPSSMHIQNALMQQKGPSRAAALGLLESLDVVVVVQVCPVKSFLELLSDFSSPAPSGGAARDHAPLWSHGVQRFKMTITFNSRGKPSVGGFKLSIYGSTFPVIPGFASPKVAIKQCYDRVAVPGKRARTRGASGQDHSLAPGILSSDPSIHVLESGDQIISLSKEIMCSQWGNALMELVYERVAEFQRLGKVPAYEIPQMRYVRVALAMEVVQAAAPSSQKATPVQRQVYMLEEYIDPSECGKWRKYINNASAFPLPMPESLENDRVERNRREFLVFAQHVQYLKTKGQAYVSDFQGAGPLLSDPQIMTNPDLGDIFGGGNLGSAFQKFADEHNCSKFCRFYELDPLVASHLTQSRESDLTSLKPTDGRPPGTIEHPPTITRPPTVVHPTRNDVSYRSSKEGGGSRSVGGKGKERAKTPLFNESLRSNLEAVENNQQDSDRDGDEA